MTAHVIISADWNGDHRPGTPECPGRDETATSNNARNSVYYCGNHSFLYALIVPIKAMLIAKNTAHKAKSGTPSTASP